MNKLLDKQSVGIVLHLILGVIGAQLFMFLLFIMPIVLTEALTLDLYANSWYVVISIFINIIFSIISVSFFINVNNNYERRDHNGETEHLYPQSTPKQRVIALLKDMIKAGY